MGVCDNALSIIRRSITEKNAKNTSLESDTESVVNEFGNNIRS